MVINIALLLFVFGAERKKKSPYLMAAILGGIKAAIYVMFTRDIVLAIIMGCAFGALAAAFVYFLKRLDRPKKGEGEKLPTYTIVGSEKADFKWEYIPLVFILLLLIGGEALLS